MSFASVFQHLKDKFGEPPHNNTRDLVEGQIIGIHLQNEENIDFILEDVLKQTNNILNSTLLFDEEKHYDPDQNDKKENQQEKLGKQQQQQPAATAR